MDEIIDQDRLEASEDTVRVITLGWQAILLPVLALGTLWIGLAMGRAIGGNEAASQAPPVAAPVPVVPVNPNASSANSINPAPLPVAPGNQFPEGAVIELPKSNHPMVGRMAHDFTVQRLGTGEKVSLRDFRGKPVMVDFWATWCPPCRFEMPWLESAYEAHKDEGFVILAVDAGERVAPSMVEQTVQSFVDEFGLTFPVLLDDNTYNLQREWGVYGLPSAFLINAEGTVEDVHVGMFPNQATLEKKLESILQPGPSSQSE